MLVAMVAVPPPLLECTHRALSAHPLTRGHPIPQMPSILPTACRRPTTPNTITLTLRRTIWRRPMHPAPISIITIIINSRSSSNSNRCRAPTACTSPLFTDTRPRPASSQAMALRPHSSRTCIRSTSHTTPNTITTIRACIPGLPILPSRGKPVAEPFRKSTALKTVVVVWEGGGRRDCPYFRECDKSIPKSNGNKSSFLHRETF